MLILMSFFFFVFALLTCGIVLIVSGYRRRSAFRFVSGVLFSCVVLLFTGVMINWYKQFSWEVYQHTNPNEYQHALQDWHGLPAIAHFPPAIPADASHVRFYYRPSFLQGGMSLQLRYRTTPRQIEQLYTHFTSQKHEIVHVGVDIFELMFQTSDAPPPPPGESPIVAFPKDFEILLLTPMEKNEIVNEHNNVYTSGVAISKKRDEIVFWAYGGGG